MHIEQYNKTGIKQISVGASKEMMFLKWLNLKHRVSSNAAGDCCNVLDPSSSTKDILICAVYFSRILVCGCGRNAAKSYTSHLTSE